jgi:7-cyano-7-deazaguanine synthase
MYVPFRNGFMISALASYVQGQFQHSLNKDKADWAIYFGAHAEDALNWAYPDCTPEFIGAMANAVYVGTYHKVRLITPLQWMNKADIIRKGTELNVPWNLTWSCYAGGSLHCGVCPTCRARRQGFIAAGVNDPTPYAATT